jgi:hypothetical protein
MYIRSPVRSTAVRPPDFDGTIDVVRGRLTEALSKELLSFWIGSGALDEAVARRRLHEVLCVLRSSPGSVVGVNSAYEDAVPLIGGRRFWLYRSFLLPPARGAWDAMVLAAYRALAAGFDPEQRGPIGLCAPIADRELLERRPEAEWQDPRLLYAGYLADGRQLRVAYFEGARVG